MNDFDRTRRAVLQAGGAMLAMSAFPAVAWAQGSRLITCLEAEPPSMNSAISASATALMACSPVYSWLIRMDNTGARHPDLATEWGVSDDGLTYTFKLRTGVTWHDGAPFTSADAKFTISEMLSKIMPISRNAYKSLQAVEAPDDHTLILKFSQPNSPFLTHPNAYGPILPRHIWEGTDFNKNPADKAPIGTGPFKFANYTIGSQIAYKRNDDYYGPKPEFAELLYRIIPDEVSRAAAFETGDIDTIVGNGLPFSEIPRFAAMPNRKMKATQILGAVFMATINMRNPILSNISVRHAIAHGIDRSFIRENVAPGISRNMMGPLWPASRLYNKNLSDYAYDPAIAKRLLDEAGYPAGANGRRFTLRIAWSNSYSAIAKMVDVIAENLRAIGINVERHWLETATLIQSAYIDGKFDILIGSDILGPDPDFGVERFYRSDNILPRPYVNNSAYVNPEVDRLFAEQRLAPNEGARKQIYDRIQELIWADLPILPIMSYNQVAIENQSIVTGCYEGWSVRCEDFSQAKRV